MAKVNYTVESILSAVITGLDAEDAEAFKGYLSAELGALRAEMKDDVFGGLTLKGKGDKAKGEFNAGTFAFTGKHSVAKVVIHFGTLALKQCAALGILPVRVDVSLHASAWANMRKAKMSAKTGEAKPVEA